VCRNGRDLHAPKQIYYLQLIQLNCRGFNCGIDRVNTSVTAVIFRKNSAKRQCMEKHKKDTKKKTFTGCLEEIAL
jgi:hypothetical protein